MSSKATVPCSLLHCGSGWRGRKPPPASIDDTTLHLSCQRIHICLPRSVRCHRRTAKSQDRHQPKVCIWNVFGFERQTGMPTCVDLHWLNVMASVWLVSVSVTYWVSDYSIVQRCGQQRAWLDYESRKQSMRKDKIYFFSLACYLSLFFSFLFCTNETGFSSLLKQTSTHFRLIKKNLMWDYVSSDSSLCNVQGLLFFSVQICSCDVMNKTSSSSSYL